tara:strand:- start:20 stop:496 length:477 start_codon:yes stop_codon:yes gene_type:complete
MIILTNLFVSLFYSGYIKVLPSGTFGSFISMLILFPLIEFNIISLELFILGFIIIFLLSLYFIKKFSLHNKSHDSKIIVIDEFLGIYLILIFYDQIQIINTIITFFFIFILFRFFDIVKIFPANIIDRNLNNALGVILDDLVAALYTIFILYIINVFY